MAIVQLTNAGAALLNGNTGPITLSTYKLGSDYNYTPSPTDTNIHGTLVLQGAPSVPVAQSANIVKYSVYLDYATGPYTFGELGLFTSDGTLFALAAWNDLLQKLPVTALNAGNSIRVDLYLSMVGTNYDMWLDLAESNNSFRMAVLGSPDQLPSPQNAVPNAYVISGAGAGQSAFQAFTDRQGLWNFSAYAYANQATATIVAFDSQSVTIAAADYVPGMTPQYTGEVILEFSTGALYGTCRYVSSVVQVGNQYTLGFDNPLMMTPIVGDKFIVFGRQALSTTIPNLPIASATQLGGIKVGATLSVTADGTLNVANTSYPVLSVNGKTGNVVLTASDITGLATVALSGNYNDLSNKPIPYTLPIANTTTLGGVKAPSDSNLTIAGDGTIDLGFLPVKSVNGATPDGTGNVTITIPTIGLINPTKIANGTDFNTLTTTGIFFGLDTDASSFLNAPNTTAGGVLDIEPFTTTASGGDVIQRYTQAGALFLRRYTQSSNTWSTWAQFQTSAAQPYATTTTPGVIIVGAGLNVTSGGLLSTQIQSVNGKTNQFIILSASDVNAVATSQLDAAGGVPELDATPGPAVPATDPFVYGRMRFWENTLGVWWTAGKWDAAANHVIQSHTSNSTVDTNTSLLANGQQTIDISYGGNGRAGLTNPDYQTVTAEGCVYEVIAAGTTNLDGWTQWDIGDLAVCVNGFWKKITINFNNVVFNAGTF
jgi:hypothetical protein